MTGLCVLFGALATALAMVGLYGVMAYTVTRRTRELGVRMALGARSPRILWMILREALWLVAAGVACALPLSLLASRVLQSELYGASAIDPITLAAATLLLAVGRRRRGAGAVVEGGAPRSAARAAAGVGAWSAAAVRLDARRPVECIYP